MELAVYVAEQASSGLYYAHSYKDKISGDPLNIVHRDISPQNILISYEGNVKIIDFGIAKATTNLESTRAGVIKGKPSYLSPEQISGDPLDGRSDIFALGIVVWELLVGKKLFSGENELAVLKLIEACTTHVKPPSTFNNKVPKELDAIVMKALSKSPDKRYQTADEMQRALHKFLYTFSGDFNPSDLAYYAKDLFKDQIVEDRKKMKRLNDQVEELLTIYAGPPKPAVYSLDSNTEENSTEDTTTVVEGRRRSTGSREFSPEFLRKGQVQIDMSPEVARSRAPVRGGQLRHVVEVKLPPAASRERTKAPVSRAGEYRDRSSNRGGSGGGLGVFATAAVAVIAVAGVGPRFDIRVPILSDMIGHFIGPTPASNPTPTPAPIRTSAPVNLEKTILLKSNIQPPGGDPVVLINEKQVDAANPAATIKLDAPVTISVERRGYKPVHNEFYVEAAAVVGRRELSRDILMEPVRFGFLTLHSTPNADAKIMIDGKDNPYKTPMEAVKLPAGAYTVRLRNEVLGMETSVTVNIEEGKSIVRDVKLEIKN